MKKTIGALMVAVSALALSANAEALEYNPYAGVDYTYNNVSHNGGDNFNGGKVYVGAQYNQNFGTEVFLQRTLNDGHQGVKHHFTAYGVDLMGYLPLGCEQKVALLGTAGLARYNVSSREAGVRHEHDYSMGYRLGAGAEYNVNDNVAVRAIARYVDLGNLDSNGDMWEYSLGAKYNF